MISLLLNIPAATNPLDVVSVFDGEWIDDVWIPGAGYKCEIPTSGIMPASQKQGGKAIVHCIVSGASYQDILDVTSSQRPVWQIFSAQNLHPSPNPDYDPDDPESPPMITVVHKPMNVSVWQFMPDNIDYDQDGNPIGTTPQNYLHEFQGTEPFPNR